MVRWSRTSGICVHVQFPIEEKVFPTYFTSTWLPLLKWTRNAISSSTLAHNSATYSFSKTGLAASSSVVGKGLKERFVQHDAIRLQYMKGRHSLHDFPRVPVELVGGEVDWEVCDLHDGILATDLGGRALHSCAKSVGDLWKKKRSINYSLKTLGQDNLHKDGRSSP